MTVTPDENERNTLLLKTLMDLVPDSELISAVAKFFANDGNEEIAKKVPKMLEGYGTLLCIIQAAVEYDDDEPPISLCDRLSYAYFELTNNDDGGDDVIRLKE